MAKIMENIFLTKNEFNKVVARDSGLFNYIGKLADKYPKEYLGSDSKKNYFLIPDKIEPAENEKAKYLVKIKLGKPDAELKSHRQKNFNTMISKYNTVIEYADKLTPGIIIETDTPLESLLLSDSDGDYYILEAR